MNRAEIIETQKRVGTPPDGFWGPKSTLAAQRHLEAMMPERFPTQSEVRSGRSVFGRNGEPGGYSPPFTKIQIPFHLHLYGDPSRPTATLTPHEACADAMLAVFQRLDQAFPSYEEKLESGILAYYGLYNPRAIRGGNFWSMHAYRIAIDLDATRNGNRAHWPASSEMPIRVMECFAKEGFLAAGAFWGRDAMHFQATSV